MTSKWVVSECFLFLILFLNHAFGTSRTTVTARCLSPPKSINTENLTKCSGVGGGGDTCDRLTSHSEEVATLPIDNAATSTTDWLPISPNDIMRLNHRGNDHQLTKLLVIKQILLISNLGNLQRSVWRISILMLRRKWLRVWKPV